MRVEAVDHVNILTDDLDRTAAFYEAVIGLRRGETPGATTGMGFSGAWMFDATGHPLVHLVWRDADNPAGRYYGSGHVPGQPTGAIHHVALRCQGFAAMKERLAALGVEHRVNDGILGLKQIFVSDPNAVLLELNFAGE